MSTRPWVVPLFPLPNVVLLPRGVLPLHVFEERYKLMTAHALEGRAPRGRIAMAMLRPGWEKQYHARPAIEPVVCVGQILSHEKLADGKYNFLLQGLHRCRVVREVGEEPYRQAEVEPVPEWRGDEAELAAHRRRMLAAFASPAVAHRPVVAKFAEVLSGPIETAEIADLIAFNFIDDVAVKQQLLAEGDVCARVGRVADEVEAVLLRLKPRRRPGAAGPSMN